MAEFFRRVEKKYIITNEQYECIKNRFKDMMIQDVHGKSKICNIYFDTDNYELISHSIQKPIYKDKIRLRSYNTPKKEDLVYLEVKRKYEGVVSKRRLQIKLKDVYKYFEKGYLQTGDMQIKSELDYYFKHFKLKPTMFLSYDREAFYSKEDENFRITFDSNIIARNYDLNLEEGNYGVSLLEKEKYIMEIKTLGAIPLYFVEILSDCNIYPCGFSKYGEAYTQLVLKKNNSII